MDPHDPAESSPTARRRPTAMASFGEELRRERELRGVPLREIAEATKVNLRFLEALERNEFDTIPGGLFTRGFIRAYANHIGADPEKLVNAYLFQVSQDHERADRDASRASIGPRLEVPEPEPTPRRRLPRWAWALIGLVALIALLALLVFMFSSGPDPGEDASGPAPAADGAAAFRSSVGPGVPDPGRGAAA